MCAKCGHIAAAFSVESGGTSGADLMLSVMQKSHRVLLHLACIARKTVQGRECRWHWQHLLREFGIGEYSSPEDRQKQYPLEVS